MAYYSEKETYNPFFLKAQEKWKELKEFGGNSIVEKIVKSISILIVFCILVLIIPVGVIISIYNSFYNLQKKAYDDIMYYTDSPSYQFISTVEYGVYSLMSLPFFLLLAPYWVFATISVWVVRNKKTSILFILVIICFYLFKNDIYKIINRLFYLHL